MQRWIEIESDGVLYHIDQAKVSAVGKIRTRTEVPHWFSKLLGDKTEVYYTVGFIIDGRREVMICDSDVLIDKQRSLLLGKC